MMTIALLLMFCVLADLVFDHRPSVHTSRAHVWFAWAIAVLSITFGTVVLALATEGILK